MLAMKYDEKQRNWFFFFLYIRLLLLIYIFFSQLCCESYDRTDVKKDYYILLIFYSQCFAHAAEKLSLSDGQSLTWEMKRTSFQFALKSERKSTKKHEFVWFLSLWLHVFFVFLLSGTGVWRCRHIKSPAFKVAFSHESEICVFLFLYLLKLRTDKSNLWLLCFWKGTF